MLKAILILVAGAIAAVLIYAATRPDSFRVKRSVDIAAAPDKISALINDLRSWRDGSPYEKKDPAILSMQPQGTATRVTWAMSGPGPFIAKLLGVFLNRATRIGGDFEAGLAQLKPLTES